MTDEAWPKFGIREKIRMVSRIDIAGGGQVVVQDGTAFVGHMDAPHGTSILDVKDPKHPRVIAHVEISEGLHSHKVQVSGDLMVVNYERMRPDSKADAGLKIFNVSNRQKPREIGFYKTAGGVLIVSHSTADTSISRRIWKDTWKHRHDFGSPGSIATSSRWGDGGCRVSGARAGRPRWESIGSPLPPSYPQGRQALRQLLVRGNGHLDISEMSRPKLVSHLDWSPPYPAPTHTTLPIPWKIKGRDFLVVTDEEIRGKWLPNRPPFSGWSILQMNPGPSQCRLS